LKQKNITEFLKYQTAFSILTALKGFSYLSISDLRSILFQYVKPSSEDWKEMHSRYKKYAESPKDTLDYNLHGVFLETAKEYNTQKVVFSELKKKYREGSISKISVNSALPP